MRIFFLIIAIALVHTSASAHNALTARFELNSSVGEGEAAFLNINLSQTGLHQTLIKAYPTTDFSTITNKAYKELAVKYIKENTHLKADNVPLELGEGGIKLGNHQTDLKFMIKSYPKAVKSLAVEVTAFNKNDNHHTFFWWTTMEEKIKVILSPANDFKGVFHPERRDTATLLASFGINQWAIFIGGIASLLFLGIFIKKRRQQALAH